MGKFAVIGAGRFGRSVASKLVEMGQDVILIDRNEARIQSLSEEVPGAVQLDAIDERALRTAGIEDVEAAVVSTGQKMEASILISMLLKDIGVRRVVAKAISEAHAKVLSRIGVDRIVRPEKDMGERIAKSLASPTILDQIEVSSGYNLVEIVAPKGLLGDTLKNAKVRERYGINVIAIKRSRPELDENGESRLEEEVNLNPQPDDVVQEGDVLLVIGSVEDIEKFQKE